MWASAPQTPLLPCHLWSKDLHHLQNVIWLLTTSESGCVAGTHMYAHLLYAQGTHHKKQLLALPKLHRCPLIHSPSAGVTPKINAEPLKGDVPNRPPGTCCVFAILGTSSTHSANPNSSDGSSAITSYRY